MIDATSVYARMLVHHIESWWEVRFYFCSLSFDNWKEEEEEEEKTDENARTSWQRKVTRYCRFGIQSDAWRHFDWCACLAFFGVEVV